MIDQYAAWHRVPAKLKAIAVHLGVVTPWSAFDWGAMFMGTIEAEARSRARGDAKLEAGLRVAMIDLVAGLGLDTFERLSDLGASAWASARVREALEFLLREADFAGSWGDRAFREEILCEPAAEIVERLREAVEPAKVKPEPRPTRARRLSRRARGRW